MKIAISASSPTLSSPVDPRFGRCPYFLFVDPESMEFEAVENPNVATASGAGIQAAQMVANKGAQTLLTGSCGPNAFQTLQAAGVEVFVGISGTAEGAVKEYKSGKLRSTTQPNAPPHSGMGMGQGQPMGPGPGMGGGMGRGMGGRQGGGMGRGMGRGRGQGMGYGPFPQTPGMPPSPYNMSQIPPEDELKHLKQQAELLRKHLDNISKKIEELEKNE
jgi:predicted Fe-Mo cluster-binding NifX family protein